MEVLNGSQDQNGRMIMLYGETGVGKTTSILQSAPDPLLYVQVESRNLKPSVDAARRSGLKYRKAMYATWEDAMDFLNKDENTTQYSTVVMDSFSHLMNVKLTEEVQNESFEALKEQYKAKGNTLLKPLAMQAKTSQEGYGTLAAQMFRMTDILGRISQRGKIVIVTCLVQERPKWNRELTAAPALAGRMYPDNMPGFFDLIGYVYPRLNEGGEVIYPPMVSFETDKPWLAKFTGVGSKRVGPLNIEKILERVDMDEAGTVKADGDSDKSQEEVRS